ncbi:MAG: 30S ribosomal protein S12 methylthiotransferase RimO [Oscillospiraceae bacterium]|nr:30S ribosomal protein S12 methylthiotransferase RimO [Oscillospiraceae bacterium]MBP0987972.1 30S ribosomal protein S12 methylthiotransferase RimO [Oscillospiraceae bacterium]MBQ5338197.1 30S ribosomal protein S12 methylthiotransferase RimO [Oscillospiraceae bacterium]
MIVSMVSLGCAKNLVDSERMLHRLKEGGYTLTTNLAEADIAIVNTCGFIQAAKEEAIDTVLELGALKASGSLKRIVITGCLAERYREEVAAQFPEADAVIGIGDQTGIVEVLDAITKDIRVTRFAPKCNMPLTGERIVSTLPFYAYLKVAEGCSNGCTYCAIPAIRGKFRSVPMEEVLAEAAQLSAQGVTELIVIAQDTTRYGEDLYGQSKLPALLTELCKIDGFRWIRVLYCYPERITDELIDVIAREDKIVKYLDIPVQHSNDAVLKAMRRKCDAAGLRALFKKLRERIPGLTLRTTLLVGFPGETDEQFTELSEFVQEMRFDRLGCFAYSEEEGTVAARMENQVDEDIRQRRADLLMEQQMQIAAELNAARVGTDAEAVIEGYDREAEAWLARTAADAPDIDGRLYIAGAEDDGYEIGQYVQVHITATVDDYDLIGEVN